MTKHTIWGEGLWLLVTNPPEMEDSPQLFVDSIQKEVWPGGPVLVYGGHGRHAALQAQEVFLHLGKKKGKGKGNAGSMTFRQIFDEKPKATFIPSHNSSYIQVLLTILWMVKS